MTSLLEGIAEYTGFQAEWHLVSMLIEDLQKYQT